MLPQLAVNIGWLRLMGEALVEQTERQRKGKKPLTVSEQRAKWRERKRLSKKPKRRGLYGLHKAMMTKPRPAKP